MNTTRYFKLGLFMLTASAALVAGAITLGAGGMFTDSIPVVTVFDESVSGLGVGSPVKHRGVTVGQVESISFPRDVTSAEPFKYVVVRMAIDPNVASGVTEQGLRKIIDQMVAAGLRARIAQSGLTGSAYVELNYLDPASYPVAKAPVRTQDLYIPSAPGAFNQVVDALTDIATKLQRADLEKVIGHVDSLVLRVDKSVQDLQVAGLRAKADAVLDNIQSATERVRQILDDPKVAQVIADLPEISGRVRSVAARVDELVKNGKFEEAAAHLRHLLAEADALIASQSDTVRTILADLRAAIANARQLTEEVKSNPSRLFFGGPPPRTAYGRSK